MVLDDIDVNFFLQVHDADSVGTISATDISVSCPLCREGKSWKRKHRLHLYIKPSYDIASVHCWNCGYSSNIFGYLKEFHPTEFSQYSKAKRGSGFSELKKEQPKKDDVFELPKIDIGMDMGIDNDIHEEKAVSKSEIEGIDIGFSMSDNIIPTQKINKNSPILIEPVKNLIQVPKEVHEYIENRGIKVQEHWLYSPKNNKIRFNNTDIILSEYIVVPLMIKDKWYGFQALAWKQKKFFVYLVTGNTSWKVENWDGIDKEKEVFIFESIYDRLSSGMENSIAVLGANLHEDRIKELKSPVFCLDNNLVDSKAHEEIQKYVDSGYKCFIWPKGSEKFKDTNDLRKINVPYEKIKKMIKNNLFQGLSGSIRLKLYDL